MPRIIAKDRADRQIYAAGDDDEGHGERHEAHFGHQPSLIEKVAGGEEAVGLEGENDKCCDEQHRQDRLMAYQQRSQGGAH
jgi:hypothetical protein